MPRRRWATRARKFELSIDVVIAALDAAAWSHFWGEDAADAWLALREQLGHAGATDWRKALGDLGDEEDPRDPRGRTVAETTREFWSQQARDDEAQQEEP